MSNGDLDQFLEYLLEKYKERLLNQKVSSIKRSATADYQPREKQYERKKIRISSSTWQKYWEFRLTSGYSISCIIRIFIEWEKLQRGEHVGEPYLIPTLIEYTSMEYTRLNYTFSSNYRKMDNYQLKREWLRESKLIKFEYWDDS